MSLTLYLPLVEAIARQLYERSGKRFAFDAYMTWGLRGLDEGLESWEGPRSGPAFEAHLRGAVRLEILDQLRDEPEGLLSTLDLVTEEHLRDLLDPQERLLVVLRYSEGLRDSEAADAMDLQPEQVAELRAGIARKVRSYSEHLKRRAEQLEVNHG